MPWGPGVPTAAEPQLARAMRCGRAGARPRTGQDAGRHTAPSISAASSRPADTVRETRARESTPSRRPIQPCGRSGAPDARQWSEHQNAWRVDAQEDRRSSGARLRMGRPAMETVTSRDQKPSYRARGGTGGSKAQSGPPDAADVSGNSPFDPKKRRSVLYQGRQPEPTRDRRLPLASAGAPAGQIVILPRAGSPTAPAIAGP